VIGQNFLDHRDEKGRGLAGAGISQTNDIVSGNDSRDSFILDRCRGIKSAISDCALESGADGEIVKSILRPENLDGFSRLDFADEAIDVDPLAGEPASGTPEIILRTFVPASIGA